MKRNAEFFCFESAILLPNSSVLMTLQGRKGFEVRLLCCVSALNSFKLVNGRIVLIGSWSGVSRNYHITGINLDSIKKEVSRTNAVSIRNWVKADNKSEPFSTQMSTVSRLGSLAECSGQ